ncbi:MAG: DUF2924 domain-containing protein [Planctomycetaceae bacterium]
MDSNLDQQLAALQQQSTGELRRKYFDLSGDATNTRNRTWLIRRIAWLIQAQEAGGLSERARERAEELACDADLRVNAPALAQGAKVQIELPTAATVPQDFDSRLPIPGSLLYREYKGRVYQVLVQQQGFEMEGVVYKSLSAVAKQITGSHCNGFLFFRLTKGEKA